jgi:hypothetical protein
MPVKHFQTNLVDHQRQRAANPHPPVCYICQKQLTRWGIEEELARSVKIYGECGSCNMSEVVEVDMLHENWDKQPGSDARVGRLIGQHAWMRVATERR